MSLLLATVAAGGVTVSISGVSSTTAVGSVTPSSTVALTGLSSTADVGTLGVSVSVPITGLSSTLSVGSLVPSTSVALTGIESVTAVGTVGVSIAVPITGNVSTSAVGSVTVSIGGDVTVAISGVSSTVSVGSLTPSVSVPITGNVITTALGNLAVNSQVFLSGVESTVLAGNITASGSAVAEQPSGGWDYYDPYPRPAEDREKEKFIEKQESLEEDLAEAEKKVTANKDRKDRKNISILENRILSLREELDGLKVLNALIAEQEAVALQKRIFELKKLEEMEEEESIFMLMCMMEAA